MRRSVASRISLAVVMFAWLAQVFLPVAHAATMGAGQADNGVWCGDPTMAWQAMAVLPAEVRGALQNDGDAGANQLANCTLLCATASTPPPLATIAPVVALRAAGLEPAPRDQPHPRVRAQSPTPPAQAPPAQT